MLTQMQRPLTDQIKVSESGPLIPSPVKMRNVSHLRFVGFAPLKRKAAALSERRGSLMPGLLSHQQTGPAG
jgi:hypothetical protein